MRVCANVGACDGEVETKLRFPELSAVNPPLATAHDSPLLTLTADSLMLMRRMKSAGGQEQHPEKSTRPALKPNAGSLTGQKRFRSSAFPLNEVK